MQEMMSLKERKLDMKSDAATQISFVIELLKLKFRVQPRVLG